jgi:hypothetical protein
MNDQMAPAAAQFSPARLEPLRLSKLDIIGTPNPLTLQVGENF